MTGFCRVGSSLSVCEGSTSVGAASQRRPRLRPVTGHRVNGERWVPFTIQGNPGWDAWDKWICCVCGHCGEWRDEWRVALGGRDRQVGRG
eukprot:365798-Chlamydomonas_euryale.AAC.1